MSVMRCIFCGDDITYSYVRGEYVDTRGEIDVFADECTVSPFHQHQPED